MTNIRYPNNINDCDANPIINITGKCEDVIELDKFVCDSVIGPGKTKYIRTSSGVCYTLETILEQLEMGNIFNDILNNDVYKLANNFDDIEEYQKLIPEYKEKFNN